MVYYVLGTLHHQQTHGYTCVFIFFFWMIQIHFGPFADKYSYVVRVTFSSKGKIRNEK